MKLLVIGASGLIGSHIRKFALSSGQEVLGTYLRHPVDGLQRLNSGDLEAQRELMDHFKPDAVVYSAAMSWVDGCELDPEAAYRENSLNPRLSAMLAKEVKAGFVYLSSSYVFDGSHESYSEEDDANPINVYGKSKKAGEEAVQEVYEGGALIIRTMGVYGEERQRKNFVFQVVDKARSGQPINVPCDQYGNTTYAGDIAKACLALLKGRCTGIWNIAGPDPKVRRSDFAKFLCGEYSLDAGLVKCVPSAALRQAAERPTNAGLTISKALRDLPWKPSEWVRIPVLPK